jgi:hypothetical protein
LRRAEHLRAQPQKETVRIAGRRRTSAGEPDRRTVTLCGGDWVWWCNGWRHIDYNRVVVTGREEERRRRTDSRVDVVCVCVCVCGVCVCVCVCVCVERQ